MKKITLLVPFLITYFFTFTLNVALANNEIPDGSTILPLTFEDEFLAEDEAFIVRFDQQKNKLKVSFKVANDYYLYRNQIKFEGQQLTLSPVELPIGVMHQDEFFGAQQVYKEDFSFVLEIKQANQGASIKVTYQGCAAKGLCYPPITKTVMINKTT